MDLRKRFGQVYTHADKKNRILVVEIENKLVGLIVNAASEVLKIPPADIELPASGLCRRRVRLCYRRRETQGAFDHLVGHLETVASAGSPGP